jgi:hypothetical protein
MSFEEEFSRKGAKAQSFDRKIVDRKIQEKVIHRAGNPTTFCGITVTPFLPRTAVSTEVTCEDCIKALCQLCRGHGFQQLHPFIRCPNCRGSGKNLW